MIANPKIRQEILKKRLDIFIHPSKSLKTLRCFIGSYIGICKKT